jgi:hypothetical protein
MDAEASDERSQRIAAALAEGGAEEREVAYAAVEAAVRGAPASHGRGKEQALALAAACVEPLVVSREKQIRGSGGSLEPPWPLPMHLLPVYMEFSECLPPSY